jgi:hypothetical protein
MKWFLSLVALAAILPQHGLAETTLGTAITTVPFNITKAGVYHLTKDLDFTASGGVAINVEATDVILDLNAHELLGLSGSGSTATGIYCDNFNRVVIKNGTVRGFQAGVVLTSNEARVTDLLVTNNFGSGITVVGNNSQILHNHVCNTGGSSNAAFLYAIGISLTGTDCTVVDNDVQNTFTSDSTNHYGNGIRLKNCSNVVLSNNRVLDVEPATALKGSSTGVATLSCDTLIFLANTVVTTATGFDLTGSSSGKYGDNVTSNVGASYLNTGGGMQDIGDNN